VGTIEQALPAGCCGRDDPYLFAVIPRTTSRPWDDDDLRRGLPNLPCESFDEATAILAGDALLTLALN